MGIVLGGKRGRHAVPGRRERGLHGVADRLEDGATVVLHRLVQHRVMPGDGGAIGFGLPLEETR